MKQLLLVACLVGLVSAIFAETPAFETLKFYDKMAVSDGATGTGKQLVNTGYIPDAATILKAKYNLTTNKTADYKTFNQCLFCARKGTKRSATNPDFTFFIEATGSSSMSRMDYYDKSKPIGPEGGVKTGADTQLLVQNGSALLTVSGKDYSLETTDWSSTTQTQNPLCLFSAYGNSPTESISSGANITFYWLKIYVENEGVRTLIHCYVPARANGEGEVFIADTVEKTVFANLSGVADQFTIPEDAIEYETYPEDEEEPEEPEPDPGVEMGPFWVSPSGSDVADGLSELTPKATLEAVLDTLGENYAKIYVMPGTYTPARELVLSKAIQIIGCPRNNAPVILDGEKKRCPITLDNKDAVLTKVTVQNGRTSATHLLGGCVSITAKGGTVSDCIIQDGRADTYWNAGGGCLGMAGGLATRCIIQRGYCGSSVQEPRNHGAGVHLKGAAVASNLLIRDNVTAEHIGEVVYLTDESVILNSTVVRNKGALCGGIYLANDNGATSKAYNCVIYGNEIYDEDPERDYNRVWRLNPGRYYNCAGDAEMEKGHDYQVLTGSPFRDYEGEDYRPLRGSVIIDAGLTTIDGVTLPTVDFAGRARIIGKGIDLGCYECASIGIQIIVR